MKIFDGDGCMGSPRVSGLTEDQGNEPVGVTSNIEYWLVLPSGNYSVAEVQQPGWERMGAFCKDFTVSTTGLSVLVVFRNREIRDGDVNEDGSTDSRDAAVVLQYTAGLATQDDIPDFFRGDVNLDVITDALDATLILQFDAGFIDSLPVGQ